MKLIDLSMHNAHVNLSRAKSQGGVSGCWHKATEGKYFSDNMFAERRKAAASIGLRFGAYHFARPDLHPFDPVAEADNFIRVVMALGRRDLKPVLDYEESSSHGNDAWWIREFNGRVKAKLGVWPMFYSYSAKIRELKLSSPVGNGLWLADYGRNDGKLYAAVAPAPWKKWVAHQYTSVGVVPGVDGPCDVSYAPKLLPVLAQPILGWL